MFRLQLGGVVIRGSMVSDGLLGLSVMVSSMNYLVMIQTSHWGVFVS